MREKSSLTSTTPIREAAPSVGVTPSAHCSRCRLSTPTGSQHSPIASKAARQPTRSKPSLISTWRPSLTLSRHAVTGVIKPQSTDRTDERKKQLDLNNPNQRGFSARSSMRRWPRLMSQSGLPACAEPRSARRSILAATVAPDVGNCECRGRITDMLSEMSRATSIDWPAFSALDRLVNRLRVEVRVWLHDDAASGSGGHERPLRYPNPRAVSPVLASSAGSGSRRCRL